MTGEAIDRAQTEGRLYLTPWDEDRIGPAEYTLSPGKILPSREELPIHDFQKKGSYFISPRESALVTTNEEIAIEGKITGQFIPSSSIIENGLSLTAGKLDPYYGREENPHEIIFGILNPTESKVEIEPDLDLVHLRLFDLSGVRTSKEHFREIIRAHRQDSELVRQQYLENLLDDRE